MRFYRDLLARSGWSHRSLEITAAIGGGSVLVGLAGYFFFGIVGLAFCLGILFGAIAIEALRVLANARQQALLACWPQVFEIFQTGVLSGISTAEQFEYLASSGPRTLRPEFLWAHTLLDHGVGIRFVVAELRRRFANRYGDFLCLLIELEFELGSHSMASTYQEAASQVRKEQGETAALLAKQGWVSSSAKVALLSPWLVALMLIQLPQNKQAFASELGALVLVSGLLLSFVAYALVNRLALLPLPQRVLDGVA